MLFNLVKKDLILAKKYLIIMFFFAIGAPIFIEIKTDFIGGGFMGFFLTALFTQYMLFNTVSIAEDKSKGSALLCTTPYTRNTLVQAKYLFILVIFIFNCVIYTITSFLAPVNMPMLNLSTVGISLLIIVIYFGIFIPLQYQFGYEKTKYIASFLIFISPFVFPYIVMFLQSKNINLDISLPFGSLFLYLIALIIGIVSMIISTQIYCQKDLQ